jgi:hypothetical protein
MREQAITVPSAKLTVFPSEGEVSAPVAPQKQHKCGICHCAIEADAQTTACPECGLLFHGDCWEANWGCSAYGCGQVNALRPHDEAEETKTVDDVAEPFPWEYALLGGSVLALLMGVFSFGIPSAVVGAGVVLAATRRRGQRRRVLMAAGALALVGLVLGIELSYFWWLGVHPFAWFVQ